MERSGVLRHGLLALVSTVVARFRATATMLGVVLATFLAASAANLDAQRQHAFGKARSARHESIRHVTNRSALLAQIDAGDHPRQVIMARCVAAPFAFDRACLAGIDAGFVLKSHA
jgi:hypothetical protein